MSNINKDKEVSGVKLLMAGAGKHYPNTPGAAPVSFGGATYTRADLTQRMQTFVDLCDALDTAKAAYQEKLNEADTQKPALRTFLRSFTAFVRVTFGESPGDLVDFGLAPRKVPAPRTVEAKTAAVEKNLATRKARNTMGKKQKSKVTGAVATTVPAPPTPGPAPIAPGPAASAPSQSASGASGGTGASGASQSASVTSTGTAPHG